MTTCDAANDPAALEPSAAAGEAECASSPLSPWGRLAIFAPAAAAAITAFQLAAPGDPFFPTALLAALGALWTASGSGPLLVRLATGLTLPPVVLWFPYSALKPDWTVGLTPALIAGLAVWLAGNYLITLLGLGILRWWGTPVSLAKSATAAGNWLQWSLAEIFWLTSLAALACVVGTGLWQGNYLEGWFASWDFGMWLAGLALLFGGLPLATLHVGAMLAACSDEHETPRAIAGAAATLVAMAVLLVILAWWNGRTSEEHEQWLPFLLYTLLAYCLAYCCVHLLRAAAELLRKEA